MDLLHLLLLLLFLLFSHKFQNGFSISTSDNYQITVQVPEQYTDGFIGRAFLLEANDTTFPHFKAALSVESSYLTFVDKFTCSLDVFIGDVRVWSSGHFSPFYAYERCYLELTDDGDLRLKQGPYGQIGWRSGTNAQGVQRLELMSSGNLVLLDVNRNIKWQSFNFPTNTMLQGQRLNIATRLTTQFLSNKSSTYSFEIQVGKLALYLNSNKSKYSYWEYKPPIEKNISYIHLNRRSLELFDQDFKKFSELWYSKNDEDIRYMSLNNRTGNVGMFYYSNKTERFEASFEVLNETCELPLACKPYGLCTFGNSCTCIKLNHGESSTDCSYENNEGFDGQFCDEKKYEMVELEGVESLFTYEASKVNVTKEECLSLCMSDCKCKSVFYNVGKCFLYEMIRGIRQAEMRTGASYMIKLRKGENTQNGSFLGLKKWALVLIGIVDVLVLVMVFGGFGYYLIKKRMKNSVTNNS